MRRLRVWRNAFFTLVALGLAFLAWSNRFGPSASPYLHRNRLTGAECHHGVECWIPRTPRWTAPAP
ncbi:hypothetical protein [Methylocystis parvus]|uniref:Uncharacterized protein n=1 Tax=Methylocystis parvus TaxID=134 RepID=A0A6B8M6K6_9HYPH|nr:hypothetical protein [Methylocystis parvus]QGM97329.1 hypothetical protein F7D14_07480 [Methylocystis parvus]WBJ98760.1 hypothetical protein MMG94_12135 [Methylocystis parvus OBBP]